MTHRCIWLFEEVSKHRSCLHFFPGCEPNMLGSSINELFIDFQAKSKQSIQDLR